MPIDGFNAVISDGLESVLVPGKSTVFGIKRELASPTVFRFASRIEHCEEPKPVAY